MAAATGTKFRDQAREAYALTLYTFLQLEEGKRIDRLLEEGNRIDMANLNGIAFNDPKKLKGASEALKRKIKNLPSRATAIKLAAEIWKKANQPR